MKKILDKRKNMVALMIPSDETLVDGHNFFTDNNRFIQFGIWNFKINTKLQRHLHKFIKRETTVTNEIVVVMKGKIMAEIYDSEKDFICKLILNSGDVLVIHSGGHGYEILEEDTRVYEIKNGPYSNPELDRERF
jgi:hypothetical protein